jgi:hypothetical protein
MELDSSPLDQPGRTAGYITHAIGDHFRLESDAQLKTLGLGKGKSPNPDSGWGTVEIIVYLADTEAPTQTSAVSRP